MRFKEFIKIKPVILFKTEIIPQIEKLASGFIQSDDIRSRDSWLLQDVDLGQEKRKLTVDDNACRIKNAIIG